MEKGQESKQKRKTPLTTIAISQEYAKKLDEYLNGTGITRKEFVELSVDYFQRTGFDLRGEAFDLSLSCSSLLARSEERRVGKE